MGKCRKCGKELTGIETTGWFGKLCEKCWQEQHYTQYPFKKGIDEKDKKIADLEAKLEESENFYKDLGFKDEKDARDYLIDCITQPKDLVEDVRQLKQQLEETEELNKKLAEHSQSVDKALDDSCDVIRNLKQQLAESDEYRELLLEEKAGYLDLISGYADKCNQLKQQLAETDKLMQEYLSKCLSLEQQLAEKEKEIEEIKDGQKDICLRCGGLTHKEYEQSQNQTAIDVLEEMLENEIYLNVIPDFECGDYVSSKIIRTKIEELRNGRN